MRPSRRAALGALTAASYSRVRGANDRVRLGFIGYGLIGNQQVSQFSKQPDAECAAVAEVRAGRPDEGATACRGRLPKPDRLDRDTRIRLEEANVEKCLQYAAADLRTKRPAA